MANSPTPVAPAAPAPTEVSAKPAAQAPAPTPAEVRMMKLKLADREVEMSEDDVRQIASEKASTFIEYQKTLQDHDALKARLKTNWRDVLKENGIDAESEILKAFGSRLEAEAEDDALTPEGKELKLTKAELARFKEEQDRVKAEAEKQTKAQKVEEFKGRLRATVDETIKVGNLSNSNFVKSLILQKLTFNAEHKLPIHPAVLAAEVRETMVDNFKEWLSGLNADHIWAASEKRPEVRKEIVKRWSQSKGVQAASAPAPAPTKLTKEDKQKARSDGAWKLLDRKR